MRRIQSQVNAACLFFVCFFFLFFFFVFFCFFPFPRRTQTTTRKTAICEIDVPKIACETEVQISRKKSNTDSFSLPSTTKQFLSCMKIKNTASPPKPLHCRHPTNPCFFFQRCSFLFKQAFLPRAQIATCVGSFPRR